MITLLWIWFALLLFVVAIVVGLLIIGSHAPEVERAKLHAFTRKP